MLLGYSGIGARGGTPGLARRAGPAVRGGLQRVPHHGGQAVLLVPGRRSSSLRDLLSRYDADALRYYLSVAGPETQDTDFTWAEFRRRNNDELADSWGNLVNRSVSMAAENVGAVPAPGELTDADAALLATSRAALRHGRRPARAVPAEGGDRRGDAGGRRRQPVPVRPGAVEAGKSGDPSDRERMGTILHVALQVVDDCKTLLTPFLPYSSDEGARAARRRGASGRRCRRWSRWTSRPRSGAVLPGDHRRLRPAAAPGSRCRCRPAGRWRAPTPLFTKLDESIVDEELARLTVPG